MDQIKGIQFKRISLDLYPNEILTKIIDYAGIENLIKLLTTYNRPFLIGNPNIRSSIHYVIENGRALQYNNRINRPSYIHMYLRVENFINKSNLSFLKSENDFKILDQYCYDNYINVELNLAYYIWNLIDIIRFKSIIQTLDLTHEYGTHLKYNIELEFSKSFQYYLQFEDILNDFLDEGICKTVVSLTIDDYGQVFKLNLLNFPNLKKLWLNDCRRALINGLYASKIEQLYLNTVCDEDGMPFYKLDLSLLPKSIHELRLKRIKLRNDSDFSIEKLLVNKCEFDDDPFKKKIFDLASKEIHINKEKSPYFHPWVTIPGFENRQFIESFSTNMSKLPKTTVLNELNIKDLDNPNVLYNYKFSNTLKKVTLSNNNIEDLSIILNNLISFSKLEYLNLADNPIDWNSSESNFKKFKNLKYLKLSNTHIGLNLSKILFPNSIEELSLEVNQIESIDQIKFPSNLINLGIGSNKLKVVYKPDFPSNLKTIHFTENLITKLDLSTNYKGEDMKIEILYVNFNKIKDIEDLKLPNNNYLKVLNLDRCLFNELKFKVPSGIKELSFSACNISKIDLKFNDDNTSLKYLCLSHNKITRFPKRMKLPNSIINLNLSINELSKIPDQISNLENLEFLNLAQNKFNKLKYDFNKNINLESLDLSFNKILDLQLNFLNNNIESNLKILNLSCNKLKNFNMSMISLKTNSKRQHSNLIEIDVCGNKMKNDEILNILRSIPISVRLLLFKELRESELDDIEDENIQMFFRLEMIRSLGSISFNYCSHNYCVGKRIELSSIA
ncbi:uncharacterized protein KGF55_000780 [Candida pseudojiufengensis]|uniref:uncharacterized protein n=1 Tax=Candida pseudojiufengensis TaxID=497109 RepID=UPI0022249AB6|nr:uncharacterized protein KGF55_000780 [Candida pseudojiufengensis]KAI5966471.1 hypothetical protein KGF55_000780 [Candida pseudojiufengensis]